MQLQKRSADNSQAPFFCFIRLIDVYKRQCETSFKDAFTDPSNSGVDYSGKVRTTMDNASEKSYEELRERHLEEYRSLFRRFWIDMDGSNITCLLYTSGARLHFLYNGTVGK